MPCFWGGATVGFTMSPPHHSPCLALGHGRRSPFGTRHRDSRSSGTAGSQRCWGRGEGKPAFGSCCSQAWGRPFPHTPGPHGPWLQAAPGAWPPLAGSLRPSSAKADSSAGGATVAGPPLAGIAVPSCSRDPFPEPKGPKAEVRGAASCPAPASPPRGSPPAPRTHSVRPGAMGMAQPQVPVGSATLWGCAGCPGSLESRGGAVLARALQSHPTDPKVQLHGGQRGWSRPAKPWTVQR